MVKRLSWLFAATLCTAQVQAQEYPTRPIRLIVPLAPAGGMVKVVKMPEIRDRLIAMGYRPIANTTDEFDAFIRAEIAKWAKVIRDSGARLD